MSTHELESIGVDHLIAEPEDINMEHVNGLYDHDGDAQRVGDDENSAIEDNTAASAAAAAAAAAAAEKQQEKHDREVELREQDRWLPIANVARLMKNTLPSTAKVSKDAKECMQECVSEFISFITSEASDKCLSEKRKTINGEDILFAMASLGFENYAEVLKIYLAKYREQQALKQERGENKRTKKQQLQDHEQQQQQQQQQLYDQQQQLEREMTNIPNDEIDIENPIPNDLMNIKAEEDEMLNLNGDDADDGQDQHGTSQRNNRPSNSAHSRDPDAHNGAGTAQSHDYSRATKGDEVLYDYASGY